VIEYYGVRNLMTAKATNVQNHTTTHFQGAGVLVALSSSTKYFFSLLLL
jgi:hypothetical protein